MAAKIRNNEMKRKLRQTEYILFHFNLEGDYRVLYQGTIQGNRSTRSANQVSNLDTS